MRNSDVEMVGRYQIQGRLGEGAMGWVYRAHDPEINRVLAIKVLKREFCRNPQFVSRFLREARAAGALSHPNIVTIFDVGEFDGVPYIAMELLEGEALDGAVRRLGPLPAGVIVAIGRQLADALRYAHQQGIVHRDIKPSNIMLGPDGVSIKILDFGIARLDQDPIGGAGGELAQTQCGQVLGTPRYMSPEQALGRELDGRSDLFSVGAVLYELITGRAAFDAASAAALALQIAQQDPPAIEASCPRGLRFIVEKLLAKRPEKRFCNGAAVLEALRREEQAQASERDGARRWLGLQARMALAAGAATATVMALSIAMATKHQHEAMERVAVSAGSSMVSFVASNAALAAAENMGLPPERRDWVPAQAFVASAAADPNITRMLVVDHEGVIQAASDLSLVGARYVPAPGGRALRERPMVSVAAVREQSGENSTRFARPIEYAGRHVGVVDVSVRRTELEAAWGLMLTMLTGIALSTLALVIALAVGGTQLLLRPLRRLTAAFEDAAGGDLDFRISHKRDDEFGHLFDAFNAFVASVQERLEMSGREVAPVNDLDATIIAMPATADAPSMPLWRVQCSR